MRISYKGKVFIIDLPNDTKYFKLTRKYYPDMKFKVKGEMVSIKYLKAVSETRAFIINKHHLKPKSRGGQNLDSNLLKMDISRHNAWHLLFENLTLDEIIKLLERVRKIKKGE